MSVVTDTMVLFWGNEDYMSNFYHCKNPFPIPGVDNSPMFTNSEAVFMSYKAIEFQDSQAAADICRVKYYAWECKKIGRRIKGFDEVIWEQVREDRMFKACVAKFVYNPDLAQRLLATGDKILVEASPYDKIWGIGLSVADKRALDQSQWQGQNLLGKVLMRVRKQLRWEQSDKQLFIKNDYR